MAQVRLPTVNQGQARDRYRAAQSILALALLATGGTKLYLDHGRWATALTQRPSFRPTPPGFDLRRTTIPRKEIRRGGPAKDGIPSLTAPEFMVADAAMYLDPGDRVVGVVIDGEARAYPLRILTWHEVVNDTIRDTSIAVTFCPLCDSVAVFDRRTPNGVKEFGVSGQLYNSNVLMYDRNGRPEALWSQIKSESVSGPKAGQRLKALPVELTTWADWQWRHPATKVLSTHTGHDLRYDHDPYAGYLDRPGLMFPVGLKSDRLPEKAKVLGVLAEDGTTKAYPLSAFTEAQGPRDIRDEIGGRKLRLYSDPRSSTLRVVEADRGLHWMYALWFAWYAFHPTTDVFSGR
ncbi:MAG: DUF3179 domain-containing protein [Planctomycetota bacterium]|nr:DUF3179 domain-containing protein [Planctomycetota bacterium]